MTDVQDARLPGFADGPLREYLARLASKTATPGGGSVAALTAAQAAGLIAMVANLTVGRPRFAAHDAEVRAVLSAAEELRARLTAAVDGDATALGRLIAAYKLPRATPEERDTRERELQARLHDAMLAPLAVARDAAALVPLCQRLLPIGNPATVSDIGVAAVCAQAAFQSAELNVLINLRQITDRALAAAVERELTELGAGLDEATATLLATVRERL